MLLLLLWSSLGSAAPLCVDASLSTYVPVSGSFSCYVVAGLGVDVLFTFSNAAYQFTTDGTANVTSSNITVHPFSGPGSPEAGLQFSTGSFIVPNDGTFADLSLTFGVSIYNQGPGAPHLFTSAHVGATDSLGSDPDSLVFVAETDTLSGVFSLGLSNPPDPSDITFATYAGRATLKPNVDLFVSGPGTQITSWSESFDMTAIPEPGSLALIPGGLLLFGLLRKKRLAKSILPVLAMVTMFAANSHANALCTDLSAINGAPVGSATSLAIDTYITYSNTFGGCMMNDLMFDFNSFTATGTGVPLATGAMKMIFTLNQNTGTNTKVVDIQYLPVATTTATQSQSFSFQYTIAAPLYKITSMTGTVSVVGGVTRTTLINGGTPNPSNTLVANIALNNPIGTTLSVTETITLAAGSAKHISGITETFTEVVPEPMTSVLIGSSLLGLAALAKKRRG